MFEEIMGLPLHALAVHVPIVLVPLLVLASLFYALVPKKRELVAWVAVILAVIAPASAGLAKLSGDALAARSFGDNVPRDVVIHSDWGDRLLIVSIALGVLTLALVWVRRDATPSTVKTWLTGALTVLLVVAALISAWFVFQVGDSGARMVWEDRHW